MKQLEIRLYKQHDFDLMILHRSGRVNFTKLIRDVLAAYVREETYYGSIGAETRMLREQSYYRIRITLDEKADKEVVLLMESIASGKRGIFIKLLLRMALGNASIEHAVNVLHESKSAYASENTNKSIKRNVSGSYVVRKTVKDKLHIQEGIVSSSCPNKKEELINNQVSEISISDDETELTQLFMDMFGA